MNGQPGLPPYQHFVGSLALILAAPWLAPLFASLGGKPFSAADWTLFAVMMLYGLAASTRSWVFGIFNVLAASIGAVIYAAQPDTEALSLGRALGVFGPLVLFMGLQISERYKMHWERGEAFW